MPVAHSNNKVPPIIIENEQIRDMSHSIINNGSNYQQPPTIANKPTSTGAVRKHHDPPPDYSFPPPIYKARPEKSHKKDYSNGMQEMEEKINKRIDESIRKGIEQIMGEFRKLKLNNDSESSMNNPTGEVIFKRNNNEPLESEGNMKNDHLQRGDWILKGLESLAIPLLNAIRDTIRGNIWIKRREAKSIHALGHLELKSE